MIEQFRKQMEKLIAALFLVGCASTQNQVESAIKAVNNCEYLTDYAESIADALNAKDYTLALNVANAAYLKTLETPDTPCLDSVKELVKETQAIVLANASSVNQ